MPHAFAVPASGVFFRAKFFAGKRQVTAAGSGLALPGVSVKVNGTGRGATTDTSGRFSIVAQPGETLVFSYTLVLKG